MTGAHAKSDASASRSGGSRARGTGTSAGTGRPGRGVLLRKAALGQSGRSHGEAIRPRELAGKRGERGQAANLFPLLRQLRHELALLPDGGKKLLLLPQLDHEAVKEGVELAERACELHDSELGAADDEPLRKPAACPGGDFATSNVKLG